MPVMTVGTGRALIPTGINYNDLVMGTGPIAYWPLWETSGTVAHCLVNPLQDGTYNSDVSGWPPGTGIGDGNTAPTFDGINDAVAISTATLAAAYDGEELSLMVWSRADDWVSGVTLFKLCGKNFAPVDRFFIQKNNTNDRFEYFHIGSSVTVALSEGNGQASVVWRCAVMTVSKIANQSKGYVDAAQVGVTGVGLGAWGRPGILVANETAIGASSLIPLAGQWKGGLAHVALWDRVLAQPEITELFSLIP